jgi:hypothetical protein
MRVYFEVEQRSLDWFLLKHGKIGGTRAKGLFTKTDTLLYELLAEHTERYDEDQEDSFESFDMERGNALEPQARHELGLYTGLEFLEAGWIQSDIELLGISPDGITNCLTSQCEIKCLSAKNHIKLCLKNEIPLEHINQCIHAFSVNPKLETLYFCGYRPESIKPLTVHKLTLVSLVNIGTEARPIIKSVKECVEESHKLANEMQIKITESINKLNF